MALQTGFRLQDTVTYTPELTTIWDGQQIRDSDDNAQGGHLIIGYSGTDPEALTAAGSTQLSSAVMAGPVRPRDEIGTITCRAVYDRGATQKEARDKATAIMVAVGSVCRSDPTLGIDASATIGGVIVRAWVTAGTLLQYLQNSYTAEWEFTVTFKGRV